MKRSGISQETLKLIACVTMLVDHIGASLALGMGWRIIGRIAFPIYCFLLAEGVHHTKNPRKYALRLGIGMLLSELPFDYALFGFSSWYFQSVMVTLLLGFFALELMKLCPNWPLKLLSTLPFLWLGEAMYTDYGGWGVALILIFGIARELPRKWLFLVAAVCAWGWLSPGISLTVTRHFRLPIEMIGVLALIPIALYNGEKRTQSKVVQWAFYLFYPVHLSVLAIVRFL